MLNVMALINGSLSDALGLSCACCLQHCSYLYQGVALVVYQKALRAVLCPYVYFALVESGMLLSFGGLALQGGSAAVLAAVRWRVVAAADDETTLALGTLFFPLELIHDGVRRKLGNSIVRPVHY